jgi:hypothetical protein
MIRLTAGSYPSLPLRWKLCRIVSFQGPTVVGVSIAIILTTGF